MEWITETFGGVQLSLRVVPGSRKTEVDGEYAGALKIRLRAPPVEGKANRELVRFLAKELGVSKSGIRIIAGEKSRQKRVVIDGIRAAEAAGLLHHR